MKKHSLLFFLDEFHRGSVNHITHFVGFTVLGYGLGKLSLTLILISPLIMESGHLFNYLKGIHREHALKITPTQTLAWLVFVGVCFLISKLLK